MVRQGRPAIEVREVTRRFGGVVAVDGVSLSVPEGETVGLIGPNGAGKTTLFSVLAGQIRPTRGTVLLAGERIDGRRADEAHRLGLVRTFQIPRPFRRLTLLENVLLSRPGQAGDRLRHALLGRGRVRREEEEAKARALALLDEVGLSGDASRPAGNLSGGQQKLLELARALMAEPKAILLDEPCAGVAPALIEALSGAVERLRGRGITAVIVEHDIPFVMRHCSHVFVMAQGRLMTEGPPEAIRDDPRVLDAFLGAAHG